MLVELRRCKPVVSTAMRGEVGVTGGRARLPPRWFIKTFWHVHRRIVRASGGRKGLWVPRPGEGGAPCG